MDTFVLDTIRWILFIDFMLKGKSLLDYINLFFRKDYEKKDKTTLENFQ